MAQGNITIIVTTTITIGMVMVMATTIMTICYVNILKRYFRGMMHMKTCRLLFHWMEVRGTKKDIEVN